MVERSYPSEFRAHLLRRRHVSIRTADTYELDLRRLERYVGVPREQIRAHHAERFLESEYAFATKERGLVAIRIFHRWAADRDYIERDPDLLDLRMPRRHKSAKPALTLVQANDLLSHVWRSRDVRIGYLGLYAGLRLEEMADVDEDNWVLGLSGFEVIQVDGKGGKLREIPVHPEISKMRDRILMDTVSRRQLARRTPEFKELLDRPDFTAQMLRRTFAQMLRERGVDRDVRAQLMGHALTGVGEVHYAPPTTREMHEGILALDYSIGQMRLW